VAGGDTGVLLTNTNANVAIALSAAPALEDTTTAITPAGLVASTNATTTINYVTATGGDQTADLSNTNLSTQGNAQNAESVLNNAITYVAAQDGYLGAQINTLNAISQVMSTQQENVVSAQNAVQATDYASATSNMSKYEILSQTGIAALAQANSVQQEVTKLLQ
jgi:flagellin